jgi:hypothetical protein
METPEVVYKNYLSFLICGERINLFSEKIEGNRYTIVEYSGIYNHIGDEPLGLSTAIIFYEQFHNINLNDEEMRQILIDNGVISEAT